jgi:hypothetical protein
LVLFVMGKLFQEVINDLFLYDCRRVINNRKPISIGDI